MNRISKKFLKDSYYLTDLKLCTVRLIDNSKFPWIILIPNRKKVTDITDLKPKDQILLMKEIVFCSNIMKKIFKTSKLNVEKIGNRVPQLHIHIIARFKKDSSWPLSVWVIKGKPYLKMALEKILIKIKKGF
jgi:diadenosine tetraphosphate (Ap4A) HIT family hydrolase|tara:strand:- start:15 stop:410 length:396 start_codon:yes stop_codon:yes gene_type:complete